MINNYPIFLLLFFRKLYINAPIQVVGSLPSKAFEPLKLMFAENISNDQMIIPMMVRKNFTTPRLKYPAQLPVPEPIQSPLLRWPI